MKEKYTIHRIGTPKLAFPNTEGYWASEWWSNDDGWGHKSTATVFDSTDTNLPLDGEWVTIYVDEPAYGYCDHCGGTYLLGSDDHNGETGNHYECEVTA